MQPEKILPTIQAYTKAFNFVCQVGFAKKNTDGVSLHKKTYTAVRGYLPSQLAISSRMKATEALASVFTKTKHKKYGSCPVSKSCSIRYDKNSYSLFLDKKEVSLLTISGRKRFALAIPEYYKEQFASWRHCSADLTIRKKQSLFTYSF
jgi:predicted transposase